MVSERKKAYMRAYNQRSTVKLRKAEYMQKVRAQKDKIAARNLVSELLELGYENLAYDYALERAPEMLAVSKVQGKRKKQ